MRGVRDERGQMTVELCIVFPVVIIIAVIAVNALLFFSQCASFDRSARNAVRVFAASPSTQDDQATLAARIGDAVSCELGSDEVTCVPCTPADGVEGYQLTYSFRPTLFGMGLVDEVGGVPLPKLTHTTQLALDAYAPQAQVTTDG